MTKKRVTKPKVGLSAEEIVDKWHDKLVASLNPWFLEPRSFTILEAKLRRKIDGLLKKGRPFTAADMRNSLKVAGDAARICKILQPAPHRKEVRHDTFQLVLKLCATHHQVCKVRVGGAGGWCNINS
jgi:hypothetical protein